MLKVYELNQSREWDSIVTTFKDYDVYWLSGYVKAFQIHGDGEPLLFYFEDSETRGINVVMKRDIANDERFSQFLNKNEWFDFSTPYGYGGWLIEGTNTKQLFEEYFDWCKSNNIVCEFVRFHPIVNNHETSKGYYDVVQLGNTVCVDNSNKDAIWTNFTSKNRNVIRKAIKAGIQIKNGFSAELLELFIEIYNTTMSKDNADDYYFFRQPFYDSIFSDLKENSTIFYAELDDKIIAASIMLYANGKVNYHLSGSLKEYQHQAPSNLLLYEAAKWGSENGMKTFHLGGGVGSEKDGLFMFKKAFNKSDNLPFFFIGKKIIHQEQYNRLLSLRNAIEKKNYFPEYRG